MYCVYGNSGWYIHGGAFGGGPLLGGSVIGGSTVLPVLPHSNVDHERAFSMVGKIETKSRSQFSPSTTFDLLTVKMNHIEPCYACTDTVSREFIDAAKTATRRRLQNQ